MPATQVQLVPDFPDGADVPPESARPPGMSRAQWRAIRIERWEAQVSEHLSRGETWDAQAGVWRPPQIDTGDERGIMETVGDYATRPPRAAAAAAEAAWGEMSGGQPHEAQWTPEAYDEAGIERPGAQHTDDGAVVQVVSPSGRPLTRVEIVMAFVKAVLRNPDVIEALKRKAGVIMRPKPKYRGSDLNRDMLWVLLDALPSSAKQAMHQYLSGFPAPVKLGTAAENYFYAFLLLDGAQALDTDLDVFKNRCC